MYGDGVKPFGLILNDKPHRTRRSPVSRPCSTFIANRDLTCVKRQSWPALLTHVKSYEAVTRVSLQCNVPSSILLKLEAGCVEALIPDRWSAMCDWLRQCMHLQGLIGN